MSLQEALDEFVNESYEMLERLNVNLALFEKGEINEDALNAIYRDIHTIKGTAQLFGCSQIGDTTHSMENVFSPIRDGEKPLTSEVVDLFFEGLDIVKGLVDSIKQDGEEKNCHELIGEFIPRVDALEQENLDETTSAKSSIEKNIYEEKQADEITPSSKQEQSIEPVEEIEGFHLFDSESVVTLSSNEALVVSKETEADVESNIEQTVPPAKQMMPKKDEQNSSENKNNSKSSKNSNTSNNETIRVQVGILDNLMNVVGELVLVRNLFLQLGNSLSDQEEFSNITQRLNIVTSELQSEVMKTRMQPIGNVLTKFHRVIRDISKSLDKKIDLVLEGTETELDKTLVEAVKDPLTHIVRNSADHGLETPKERIAAGKPEMGTVYIRSYHEGGQIVVEVEDDGKGLDKKAIANKCIEKGIMTEENLSKMSEKEIQNLIFMPGFSTAAQVSTISGRGVGMDVVRTNIEKIGGMVDLDSVRGKGTTIKLKIPLTLAIVPALIISSDNKNYAIPQVKLEELVRIQSVEGEDTKLEILQGKLVYRLRERLLPLISLREILQSGNYDYETLQQKVENEGLSIAVLKSENDVFGLIVDSIEDSTDIVIKPLTSFLKNIGVYSGATVLGDGSVSLTLDVLGLAQRANLVSSNSKSNTISSRKPQDKEFCNRLDYLSVDLGGNRKHVIPIAQVNRLEEFKVKDLQKSGDIEVISYGKQILPIVDAAKVLGYETNHGDLDPDDQVFVVVVERTDVLYGIKVKAISDVMELDGEINTNIRDQEAVIGNILNGQDIIVVIDVYFMISTITKVENEDPSIAQSILQKKKKRLHILLAEDTGFFRKYVSKILHEYGFDVTSAVDGKQAFEILEENPDTFDLILSDIEMPKMNGLEFASKVRENRIYDHIPTVALTTRFSEKDQEKGYEAGFDRYLEKLNADKLMQAIDELLDDNKGVKVGA